MESRGNRIDPEVAAYLKRRIEEEPYARHLGMRLVEVDRGFAVVESVFDDTKKNIFGWAHGGALFSLMDEAFQAASNSHGVMAVALALNVTYMAPPRPGVRLRAEAREVHRTARIGHYEIRLTDENGSLIARCQALAYRKTDRPIFER